MGSVELDAEALHSLPMREEPLLALMSSGASGISAGISSIIGGGAEDPTVDTVVQLPEARAPTGVRASAGLQDGEVTVKFQAPADDENAISGYVVRSQPEAMEWECTVAEAFGHADHWLSTRAFGLGAVQQGAVVVSGLRPGVPYMFSVRAVNGAGEGEWSAWSNTIATTGES